MFKRYTRRDRRKKESSGLARVTCYGAKTLSVLEGLQDGKQPSLRYLLTACLSVCEHDSFPRTVLPRDSGSGRLEQDKKRSDFLHRLYLSTTITISPKGTVICFKWSAFLDAHFIHWPDVQQWTYLSAAIFVLFRFVCHTMSLMRDCPKVCAVIPSFMIHI